MILGILVNKPSSINNYYNNISRLEIAYGNDLCIPEVLLNQENVRYQVYQDGSIGIYNQDFLYRQGKLISTNVNIAGVSGELKFDKQYRLDNSQIQLVKYQIGSNYTAVSWFTGEEMFGLKLNNYDGYNGMEALLNTIGLKSSDLIEIDDSFNDDILDTHNMRVYEFNSLGISLSIPKMKDCELITSVESIKSGDSNDRVMFILDNKIVLYLEQTATAVEGFKQNPIYEYSDLGGYTIGYMRDNPFEADSIYNEQFEIIIDNIDNINNSFNIIE